MPALRPSTGQLARCGDVAGLVARAAGPRRRDRLAAVVALPRFPGEASETALMRALDDDSFFIALVAVGSLAAIGPNRDPEPVIRALRRRIARDDNEFIREIGRPDVSKWEEPTATEITELGLWKFRRVKAVAALMEALDGGAFTGDRPFAARMRARALGALGEIGDPAASSVVAAAFDDPDREVRLAPVSALGKIGGREATPALRRALKHEDGAVRRAALGTLASVGGDEALLALHDASRRGRFRDRLAAARALRRAEKGDPPGAP